MDLDGKCTSNIGNNHLDIQQISGIWALSLILPESVVNPTRSNSRLGKKRDVSFVEPVSVKINDIPEQDMGEIFVRGVFIGYFYHDYIISFQIRNATRKKGSTQAVLT